MSPASVSLSNRGAVCRRCLMRRGCVFHSALCFSSQEVKIASLMASSRLTVRERGVSVSLLEALAGHGEHGGAPPAVGELQEIGGRGGGGVLRGRRGARQKQDRLPDRDQRRGVALRAQETAIDQSEVEAGGDPAELVGERRAAGFAGPLRLGRGERQEGQSEPLVGDDAVGEFGTR